MTLPNSRPDREQDKFCENSLSKTAVDVCLDPAQVAQIGNGGVLKSADSYSSVLFSYENYNAYLIDDDSPTEYTVYYFNYGIEQFHMTIIPDQLGSNTVQKLSPKATLQSLRYVLSLVAPTDVAGKTVAILYAIGNSNRNTVFTIVSDPSGFFTIDAANSNNTVTLTASAPANTYSVTVRATAGADTIDEIITVVVA